MKQLSTEVIQSITPLIIGVSGMVLSLGILISNSDRETKLAVRDIALSAVSISGGLAVGQRIGKRETNIQQVDQLENTNPDK